MGYGWMFTSFRFLSLSSLSFTILYGTTGIYWSRNLRESRYKLLLLFLINWVLHTYINKRRCLSVIKPLASRTMGYVQIFYLRLPIGFIKREKVEICIFLLRVLVLNIVMSKDIIFDLYYSFKCRIKHYTYLKVTH